MSSQADFQEDLLDELYKLNGNIQSLIVVLAKVGNKPLKSISDNELVFEGETKK